MDGKVCPVKLDDILTVYERFYSDYFERWMFTFDEFPDLSFDANHFREVMPVSKKSEEFADQLLRELSVEILEEQECDLVLVDIRGIK